MEGVTEVRQLDDKRLHWEADVRAARRLGARSSTTSRTRGSLALDRGTRTTERCASSGRRGEHATP